MNSLAELKARDENNKKILDWLKSIKATDEEIKECMVQCKDPIHRKYYLQRANEHGSVRVVDNKSKAAGQ